MSNHQSLFDVWVLIAYLPLQLRWVIKNEIRKMPVFGYALERMGHVYVDRERGSSVLQGIEKATGKIKEGTSVVFFPEGTFTRADGLREFHLGAFHVAAETGLSVVPVAVRGTRSILRSDQWRIRRGDITVRIGPALAAGGSDFAAALDLRNRARRSILAHCGEPDLLAR
jgi:1-acyl-sn-glycerol-3-phosphate acyltransferase